MAQLVKVNTTNIVDAVQLGCGTMCNVFNADDDGIPFFLSRARPDAVLGFHPAHTEAHVPGRHLNALLNAEEAVGIALDEDCVDAHARAAFFSFSGPEPLSLNRERIGGELVNFLPHNVQEGFHALYALACFRGSQRALELAEASIEAIFRLWDRREGWDLAYLEDALGLRVHRSTFIVGLARAIGPLVKLHRATGCARALELAIVLKEKAVDEFFAPDGRYDRELFGTHTHSTTCVMSSLAQIAELTSDVLLMERVRAFYNNGLWQIRDALGWVIENGGDGANPDLGEANNSGDVLETALVLGRHGDARCYEDAERILRGHLLPSQLRDTSFIEDPPNPDGEDGKRDVARRHLGAFGFPAPYGHEPLGVASVSFNLDIVGGAVGSLCEAYRHVVRSDQAGHWVNLLFDHETPAVAVESPYTHGRLRVRVKLPGPLFVRVPSWVDRDRLRVKGASERPRFSGGYLFLARPQRNRWVGVEFYLSERELTLHHRTRDIRVRLRGDEAVAMESFGADLTFFDPL